MNRIVNSINRWFINRHNECWIPDVEEGMGYAGKLSHPPMKGIKTTYLGILSRFDQKKTIPKPSKEDRKKILIILSGPENQRTVFEKKVQEQFRYLPENYSYNIVRGLPENTDGLSSGWFNHLPSYAMEKLILEADYIICRSGFSTIMDLIALNRTALLVPTPGQSEQEYLAAYLNSKGCFLMMEQHKFSLISAVQLLEQKIISASIAHENYHGKIKHTIQEMINRSSNQESPHSNQTNSKSGK
jgi:UDP-N-acetylglucosamine:LPS N-acetylglucosamine transferase